MLRMAAEDHGWLCGGALAAAAGLLLTRAPYAAWLRALLSTPPPVWIYGLAVAAVGVAYGWRERRLAREQSALRERRLEAQLREAREELREARRLLRLQTDETTQVSTRMSLIYHAERRCKSFGLETQQHCSRSRPGSRAAEARPARQQ